MIPTGRLSPQAQAHPGPDSAAERAGPRQRHARQLHRLGLRDVRRGRLQRPHRRPAQRQRSNIFGRYSYGKFIRDGPTASATGGGQRARQPGRRLGGEEPEPRLGIDYTLSPTLLRLPLRVLPLQGRRAAVRLRHDAGGRRRHPRPEPRRRLHLRPARQASSSGDGDRGFNFGSGLGVNRCNCPLDQDEKQFQIVANLTKIARQPHLKVGVDVRRAYNLRVPSDAHRSGELTFTREPHAAGAAAASAWRPSCSATSRASAATSARAPTPASGSGGTSTTCRTRGAPTPKLTLNYGLRLDVINPQTVNEPATAAGSTSTPARSWSAASAASAWTATSRTSSTGRRASASPTSSTRRPCSAPATAAATTSACSARSSATA